MINYIWAVMIIIGITYGALNGTLGQITTGIIKEAKEAVLLGVSLVGVIAFWTGLMEIAKNAGIIAGLTRLLNPFLNYLFPSIPHKHPARKYIATNMIANVLGLGWAATPPGLKAMEELQKLNPNKDTASIEMCTFLIVNISSVQVISINILAYRLEYGSVNPAETIGPSLIATFISTFAAVLFAKLMMKVNRS